MTEPRTAPPEDDTADAFIGNQRSVEFCGEVIIVDQFDVMQTILLIQQLKFVMGRVRSGAVPLDQVKALIDKIPDAPNSGAQNPKVQDLDAADLELVISLLAEFGEPLTHAVAIAIRKPVAFVQTSKDFVGLVRLIVAIAKVNASFFVQQASVLLADLKDVVALPGLGLTPSTVLSAPATH